MTQWEPKGHMEYALVCEGQETNRRILTEGRNLEAILDELEANPAWRRNEKLRVEARHVTQWEDMRLGNAL